MEINDGFLPTRDRSRPALYGKRYAYCNYGAFARKTKLKFHVFPPNVHVRVLPDRIPRERRPPFETSVSSRANARIVCRRYGPIAVRSHVSLGGHTPASNSVGPLELGTPPECRTDERERRFASYVNVE